MSGHDHQCGPPRPENRIGYTKARFLVRPPTAARTRKVRAALRDLADRWGGFFDEDEKEGEITCRCPFCGDDILGVGVYHVEPGIFACVSYCQTRCDSVALLARLKRCRRTTEFTPARLGALGAHLYSTRTGGVIRDGSDGHAGSVDCNCPFCGSDGLRPSTHFHAWHVIDGELVPDDPNEVVYQAWGWGTGGFTCYRCKTRCGARRLMLQLGITFAELDAHCVPTIALAAQLISAHRGERYFGGLLSYRCPFHRGRKSEALFDIDHGVYVCPHCDATGNRDGAFGPSRQLAERVGFVPDTHATTSDAMAVVSETFGWEQAAHD